MFLDEYSCMTGTRMKTMTDGKGDWMRGLRNAGLKGK